MSKLTNSDEYAEELYTAIMEVADYSSLGKIYKKAIARVIEDQIDNIDFYIGFGKEENGTLTIAFHNLDTYIHFDLREFFDSADDEYFVEMLKRVFGEWLADNAKE